jgi:uncharacterized protein YjbI with pentapeptide repeats
MLGGFAAAKANGGFAALVVSLILVLISKRALRSADARDRPLLRLAQRIVTLRGTRYTDADLTGADFTGTFLTQADMRRAVLAEAVWNENRLPVLFDDDNA